MVRSWVVCVSMAQPDIVIGNNGTTVVERVSVGTARTADPNISLDPGARGGLRLGAQGVTGDKWDARIQPDEAKLELGGGGAASSEGAITLYDGQPGNRHNPRIELSAVETGGQATTMEMAHPDGSRIDLTADESATGDWENETAIELWNGQTRNSYGLDIFAGLRGGTAMSGIESGRGQNDPSLLFIRQTNPNEVRVYPQLTAGAFSEGQLFQPGEIELLGGPFEDRRATVRLDGGQNTDGGVVSVRDKTETENIKFRGQQARVDVGGSSPGEIHVTGDPNAQVETITMEGQPVGAPGGRIAMRDTSRKTNVELRGDEGLLALGSSTGNAQSAGTHGKVTLDDGTGDTLEIRAEDGTITFETDDEGKIFEIETDPSRTQEVRTKYPINAQSL